MLSRRLYFGFSVVLAALCYAALLAAAPGILMLGPGSGPDEVVTRLNVYLRDPATILQPDTQADRQAFTARPGSVRDLLKMDQIAATGTAFEKPEVEIPEFAGRVASDTVRAAPVPMEDSLRRMEAKVLEITREAARRDLEVPRRLVRPSNVEIPGVEGFPDLRTTDEAEGGSTLSLPPSGLPSLLAQGAGVLAGGQREPGTGPDPSQPLVQLDLPTAMPILTPESEPLRAPIQQAMEAAKDERKYAFMDGLLDMELRTWRNPGDAQGYFELRITPKKGESIPVLPKDVSFVVDASSSIPQHKLNITVKGLRAALKQLKPEDRFNVVVFRDAPQYFQPEAVPATRENLQAVGKFIDNLASSGQTDVYRALQPMVQLKPREGSPGVVLVVSDGRPTAGLQDSRAIINGLTSDNSNGNGVYAFGGGKTVNRYLLDLLAYRNKGAAQVAPDIEDIEKGLPSFFLTLRDPILVDLHADFGRVDRATVFPQAMPDFFQGQPVALYGRYNPDSQDTFALRLAGQAGAEKKEVIFRMGFNEAEAGTRDIARGWAFQKAYHLIGRISREGELPELLGELKQLRTEFGVRTSYDE
jgi:hypothetical protein